MAKYPERNYYLNIHKWLSRNYGPANKCENSECKGKSKKYNYALIKGKNHEKNINNYRMLCVSCHQKYDWDESKHQCLRIKTQETKEKIRKSRIGKKHTEEAKLKISLKTTGKNNPMFGRQLLGKDNGFYGKTHSNQTKDKIRLSRASLNKSQISEIRKLIEDGIKQINIAKIYKTSPTTICDIKKGKIYKGW